MAGIAKKKKMGREPKGAKIKNAPCEPTVNIKKTEEWAERMRALNKIANEKRWAAERERKAAAAAAPPGENLFDCLKEALGGRDALIKRAKAKDSKFADSLWERILKMEEKRLEMEMALALKRGDGGRPVFFIIEGMEEAVEIANSRDVKGKGRSPVSHIIGDNPEKMEELEDDGERKEGSEQATEGQESTSAGEVGGNSSGLQEGIEGIPVIPDLQCSVGHNQESFVEARYGETPPGGADKNGGVQGSVTAIY